MENKIINAVIGEVISEWGHGYDEEGFYFYGNIDPELAKSWELAGGVRRKPDFLKTDEEKEQ